MLFIIICLTLMSRRLGTQSSNIGTHETSEEALVAQPKNKVYREPLYDRIEFREGENMYNKVVYLNRVLMESKWDDTILFLTTIGSQTPFGAGKSFTDLFDTIRRLDYDFNRISFGFLVSTEDDFKDLISWFDAYFNRLSDMDTASSARDSMRRVTIILSPFLEKQFSAIDRENRHEDGVQRLRRRLIASARNFVLINSLHNEKYTLFIDADIINIENPKMLKTFIGSGKDIIVPRVTKGGHPDYDKNSWAGQRTVPSSKQLELMDQNKWDLVDYVPHDVPGKIFHFETFYEQNRNAVGEKNKDDYLVKLDSVGGAMLFAKSIIYRQGVLFPPNYIIGTTWERKEGYDGIETEGLCYVAKVLGYGCYGMPNMVVEHAGD